MWTWLISVLVSDIGDHQRRSGRQPPYLSQTVSSGDATPFVWIVVGAEGDPSKRVALFHGPYSLSTIATRGRVLGRVKQFIFHLRKRDVQDGADRYSAARKKEG